MSRPLALLPGMSPVLLQVRKYLHVVLCFSPVGDKFRIRARQFPALVNCTSFDWFHTWPSEALVSVAARFLVDIPALQVNLLLSCCPAKLDFTTTMSLDQRHVDLAPWGASAQ